MFKAFIDDSKSEVDLRELVLAGYVQTREAWEAFSKEWQGALNADPPIQYFRMAEAENLSEQFRGWTPDARRSKVAALADVIEHISPWTVSCHMSLNQFNAILRPVAPFDLRPYYAAMQAIVSAIARLHAAKGWAGRVDFIFDDNSEIGPELAMFKRALWESLDPPARAVLGKLDHEDDKRVLPLQAADLLAWHLRRASEWRYSRERRHEHDKIVGIEHASLFIGPQFLRRMASEMSVVPHVELAQGKKGSVRKLFAENPWAAFDMMNRLDRSLTRRAAWRIRVLLQRIRSKVRFR